MKPIDAVRGAAWVLASLAGCALITVGLLTGACSSRTAGHCFRPGQCFESTPTGDSVYSCSYGDHFAEGHCDTALRVGACVTPPNLEAHRIYLYAPLHGVVPPDCERIAGPGSQFVRE